jgi:dimethylhistidine N-methyltransferase
MKSSAARVQPSAEIELLDLHPATDRSLAQVLEGLSQPHKSLPTAFLYDERGSRLFEAICNLPEYYPTRTELRIMRARIAEIAQAIGPEAMIVEWGSGSSLKTQLLLEHLSDPVAYVPVDISRGHLLASAGALAARFPRLQVLPVCADFTQPFGVPTPERAARRRVLYFPGSTIGNFEPAVAVELMRQMADQVGPGGGLLIGVDLRKDPEILEAAYDDAQGVTAQFNLNLLRRANRELGADFDLAGFRHEAVWDDALGRIEMRLVSLRAQTVRLGGRRFTFAEGERIHTEDSHKYTLEGFAELAARAGFRRDRVWTDPQRLFSIQSYTRA